MGRLGQTEHSLRAADDAALRRRMLAGLSRGERVQHPAKTVMFGRQGRFGDRGNEAQLPRSSARGLVLNAIAVENTR